jgi:hypothetical protein
MRGIGIKTDKQTDKNRNRQQVKTEEEKGEIEGEICMYSRPSKFMTMRNHEGQKEPESVDICGSLRYATWEGRWK